MVVFISTPLSCVSDVCLTPRFCSQVRDMGDYFYLDEDEDGENKPAGFDFLSAEDDEQDDDGYVCGMRGTCVTCGMRV